MSDPTSNTSGPLYCEFADDPDMLDLAQMFVDELPERIDALSQAFDKQDQSLLKDLAHQMKGAAGGYGYTPITDAARSLEGLAASDDSDVQQVQDALASLTDLCQRATAQAPEGN